MIGRTNRRALLPVAAALVCLAAGSGTTGTLEAPADGTVLEGKVSGDRRLSGRIRVLRDVVVLPGATLTLTPGSVVVFDRSESSKVDPEYFFGGTEIVVRGTLRAEDTSFRFAGRAGGLVADGGTALLSGCRVEGAEAGITVLHGGQVRTGGTLRVADCRVGIALFPGERPSWTGDGSVVLERNGVAFVRFPGASPLPGAVRTIASEEADAIAWKGEGPPDPPEGSAPVPAPRAGAPRLGDTFVDRDREVSGDVIVDGVVRVAPEATLTIAPGSRIFFAFRDADGDGIGENGLFLQGTLDARGTREKPIGFYPLGNGGRGRWDSINFMASDRVASVLEHVEIEGAYRGIHAHFSRLRAREVRISRCVRGFQFQESEADLSGISVDGAASAIRCRDSSVVISGYRSRGTISGANFLRCTVRLRQAAVEDPGWYGFRFRESRVTADEVAVSGGFVGGSVQEGTALFERFASEAPGLAGFALLDGDVRMVGFRSEGGLLDGLSASGGRISVAGGAIAGYARFAVKLGGPAEVILKGVKVTGGIGAKPAPFYDGTAAPGLGIVKVE